MEENGEKMEDSGETWRENGGKWREIEGKWREIAHILDHHLRPQLQQLGLAAVLFHHKIRIFQKRKSGFFNRKSGFFH